jgi:regulator of cell morphogenesis and NO signaling
MKKSLPVEADTRMADVIHLDYNLIPIISRFGIEYGFGNKTVAEVCHGRNINTLFFLEIINSYHNPSYFPQKKLQSFDVRLIVDYLSQTHTYYLNDKVPEIQAYIDRMKRDVSRDQANNILYLNDFFREYREELVRHLKKEDKEVFPYVRSLADALESRTVPDPLLEQIRLAPIVEYERNHDDIEIKLGDLKNLIIKYLPPMCMETCQKLLIELFRLEADLENHARIEDKVLVPKVRIIETELLEYCETR